MINVATNRPADGRTALYEINVAALETDSRDFPLAKGAVLDRYDQSGVIRVHPLTEATGEDATTGLDLLTAVKGPLVRVTADAAYDTVVVYETATARGATVIIPPAKTANISGHGPRSPARDRTVTLVKQLGNRRRFHGLSTRGRQTAPHPSGTPWRIQVCRTTSATKLTPARCLEIVKKAAAARWKTQNR